MAAAPKNTDDKRITPGFRAQAGKGRPKGVLNKSTIHAKDAIAAAFDRLGGVDALVAWAEADDDHLKVFYGTIYPKLLPLQVNATGNITLNWPLPQHRLEAK